MASFESFTPEPSTDADSDLRSLSNDSLIGGKAAVLDGSSKQESGEISSVQSGTGSPQQIPSDLERLFRKSHVYKRLAATPEGEPIPTIELTVKDDIIQALRSGMVVEYKGDQPCNAWGQYDGSLVVDGVPRYYVIEKDAQSAVAGSDQSSSAGIKKICLGGVYLD